MAYEATQARRIAAGLCKDCGTERGPSGTTRFCRPCANRHSERQSARKARLRAEWADAGSLVCNNCGVALPDASFKSCSKCRESHRAAWAVTSSALRARKEASGVCIRCSKAAMRPTRYCRWHIMDNSLRKHGISSDQYDVFWQKLESQGFRCYYTGDPLIPGVNASIDHLVPKSRGGSGSDIENCVWCDRDINALKNDWTKAEFIARCKSIADRFR